MLQDVQVLQRAGAIVSVGATEDRQLLLPQCKKKGIGGGGRVAGGAKGRVNGMGGQDACMARVGVFKRRGTRFCRTLELRRRSVTRRTPPVPPLPDRGRR